MTAFKVSRSTPSNAETWKIVLSQPFNIVIIKGYKTRTGTATGWRGYGYGYVFSDPPETRTRGVGSRVFTGKACTGYVSSSDLLHPPKYYTTTILTWL